MREFARSQRVADFLRRELGQLIQREVRDPRLGMVSVTDVEVSKDLGNAKVYVTVMGKDTAEEAKESMAVLENARGFLRTQIARINTARSTPQLKFFYDESVGRGAHLSALIDQALGSDKKHHDSEPDPQPDQ